ncbi:ATP-dependent Clp protease ATP-binding subunit [Carnobacteriaceae bacterium zg-84]|uniref:ATP-dependent Clp protease ATP-binding subunit n=1 Tax=Granulicatella sp. zg-84 TaxID=2678503 RepID=UPI0013BFC84D|nr:ATP-dependent Clp protease ATP-binding subunit [Granulicatella sp. zg-84]NEW65995.1 AAA domain-containing protein [Granulicatella sp. zg-84]QMI85861.1 ATP-dependent Clp protease ATP-binding subunit [Carnobacteriaceae bacterium zg-84]
MENKFTQLSLDVLALAKEQTRRSRHAFIGSEDLLLALVMTKNSIAGSVLNRYVSVEDVANCIDVNMDTSVNVKNVTYSAKMNRILDNALEISERLQSNLVGTEHLLLGILSEDVKATQILNRLKVDVQRLVKDIYREIGFSINEKTGDLEDKKQSKTPVLDALTRDLTEQAVAGKISKIIGRETETRRILQVLSRKNKNNPVLVGEPGVGKTAVIEALANLLVNQEVPKSLQGKRLLSLDVGSLVAGTKYRGEFEERMKRIVDEILFSGDIILFIDEIHMLVGAGGSEGSVDAANILKPALARGEIQIIGATTFSEYQKNIEKDAALERRFAPVSIDEPTPEKTFDMLNMIISEFEQYHGVSIPADVIKEAVYLSSRYISDRKLPDKAIDLIDEAASKLILDLCQNQKEEPTAILEDTIQQQLSAKDFEQAGASFKQLVSTMKKQEKQKETVKKIPVLSQRDIAQVVSSWTGVPVTELEKKESQRLLRMEKELHKRVIGQDKAVSAVSRAIRRSKSGMGDPKKPIGSFLFLGPTGVGKTELAKALADILFGSEDKMIRVDMSEFMDRHSTSRFIGSPPGFVGYDEGGQLTEKVRRQPYSVILFDEMEKAHPDVFNILLQILDDGYVTDAKGRRVDFRNTILILTSNIGATLLRDEKKVGFGAAVSQDQMAMEKTIRDELKKVVRPEFLNRIDEIVVFHSLEQEHVYQIVKLLMKDTLKRLEDLGATVSVSSSVIKKIAKDGFDIEYGARPIKRAIQKEIEDKLSEKLLDGTIRQDSHVKIGLKQDAITIHVK